MDRPIKAFFTGTSSRFWEASELGFGKLMVFFLFSFLVFWFGFLFGFLSFPFLYIFIFCSNARFIFKFMIFSQIYELFQVHETFQK